MPTSPGNKGNGGEKGTTPTPGGEEIGGARVDEAALAVAEIDTLQTELAETSKKYNEGKEVVKTLRQELAETRDELAKELAKARADLGSELAKTKEDLEKEQAKGKELAQKRDNLEKELRKAREDLDKAKSSACNVM